MQTTFGSQFLAAFDPVLRARFARHAVALESLLAARWDRARAAWPGVTLSPARFWPFVAAQLAAAAHDRDGEADHRECELLQGLRTDELYLTCACANGDAVAHQQLEARFFPSVIASLARLRLGAGAVDELVQRLRVRLFVSDGRAAKIAAYGGQGDLAAWLRVTATRLALRTLRTPPRELSADDQRLSALAGGAVDAELGHLRGMYRPQVRAALGAALASLGARDKNLLGQHYLDGLTHEQLGALYGTHRVTVARQLDAIRQRVLDQLRRALVEGMRASQRDCDSILRLVQSQLDVSLHRLLADGC